MQRTFADSQGPTDKVVFTYDAIQRKTSQLDQKGDLISYQFDMANRLLQRQYPDNLNDVFSYDAASRITQAISNRYQNTVTRSYNDDSTVATEGLTTNGENYQISHFFDTAKRNYQTTYPNGKANTRAFTARNQLSSVAYDGNLMANFQYDQGMRETSRGLGNGLTQTTSYRPDNTILQKSVAGITNYSYTYNANKWKLTETDSVNTNLSQIFTYDFEARLTSWSSNGTTLNQTQSWNLSLEGAWLANTVNGVTENRTFNQAYETLTSNSNAMTHDQKGNLTQNKDGSSYNWDFDNQLAFSSAGTPTVNASYSYDALGRRVSKTANNSTTIYVSAGYQIVTEYKSIGNSPFSEVQSFIYATYIDDPIALINTNDTYFYHSNQQFSIGAITDINGNLTERYGYNAYGKPVVITDSILVDNLYFFTGRQLDSETGLFYFRARYYDASLGQFISRDPLNYVDGMNLYRGYFAINQLDPFGEEGEGVIRILPEDSDGNVYKLIPLQALTRTPFEGDLPDELVPGSTRNRLVRKEGNTCYYNLQSLWKKTHFNGVNIGRVTWDAVYRKRGNVDLRIRQVGSVLIEVGIGIAVGVAVANTGPTAFGWSAGATSGAAGITVAVEMKLLEPGDSITNASPWIYVGKQNVKEVHVGQELTLKYSYYWKDMLWSNPCGGSAYTSCEDPPPGPSIKRIVSGVIF